MLKSKNDLMNEINRLRELGFNIYIGKAEELRKDVFNIDDLYVASIVRADSNLEWHEMDYRYVFEKVTNCGMVYYKELFSDTKLEMLSYKDIFNVKGRNMYIINPISYDYYYSNLVNVINNKNVTRKRSL